MLKGFRDFIMKGNLVELAVAFIMATAFAAVVTAFTAWIMSYIPSDGLNFGATPFGMFLTALIAFVIVAAVVYFAVVTPYQAALARFKKAEAEAEATDPVDIALLKEIRDLLATRNTGSV